MTEAQFEKIVADLNRVHWTEKLAAAHGLRFDESDERSMQFSLYVSSHHALVRAPRESTELKSRARIADALATLLSELKRQRSFQIGRPERDGLERFVLYSQKDHVESELRDYQPRNRLPDTIGSYAECCFLGPIPEWTRAFMPRDDYFENKEDYTIGEAVGWLETLLREIEANVMPKNHRRKKIGRPSKRGARDALWFDLGELYEARGGAIRVHKNVGGKSAGGRFVNYLEAILEQCPLAVRAYFARGMGDAVLDWIERGRPPSDRLHRLPLA